MDEKREITYNPADYKAVENKAKEMSKPELEEYYVSDRNRRHIIWWETILAIIGVLAILFMVGCIGYLFGDSEIRDQVRDTITETADEICPFVGEGYVSGDFFKSSYSTNKIICTEYNSGRGWSNLFN